tara:strand:- start:92 stop:811 length:720 start_codon:yes stop_codon:yes gene_type:complete
MEILFELIGFGIIMYFIISWFGDIIKIFFDGLGSIVNKFKKSKNIIPMESLVNESYQNNLDAKEEVFKDKVEKEINNEVTLCVLDLETTGFKPENSEIVEIFILKVKDNEIIDEFYSMFKPNGRITNSHIHGITNSKVKNSPTIEESNDEIINFLGNSTLVGHNLDNFDLKFLNYHLSKTLNNKTLDTLKISRKVLGNKVENHKLDTLANYFGVNPPTHQARDDVMTTFEIYKKLLSIQ